MQFLNFDTWHIKESDQKIMGQPACKAVCGIVVVPRTTGQAPQGAPVCQYCASPDAERRALIDAHSRSR